MQNLQKEFIANVLGQIFDLYGVQAKMEMENLVEEMAKDVNLANTRKLGQFCLDETLRLIQLGVIICRKEKELDPSLTYCEICGHSGQYEEFDPMFIASRTLGGSTEIVSCDMLQCPKCNQTFYQVY